ncbi:MAG: hypothetical protein H0T68_00210 [Gemmatimonadales bacterium]|nr:hypothetical protein [Gemmatimonadales bacterium]
MDTGWLAAVERSALSAAIRDSLWLYPAVETVHLLGLATLVGCAAAFDLRLLGVSRRLPARATARHLLRCARGGFALAAVSGILLFVSDPVTIAANPAFRWKLGFIAVAGLNALRFHIGPFRTAETWDQNLPAPLSARVAAAVSLTVWAAAVTAGRLIAYV